MFATAMLAVALVAQEPPRGLDNPRLYSRPATWFKSLQEAEADAINWAYNESLRTLPPEQVDVGSYGRSSPEFRELNRIRLECYGSILYAAEQQIMQAYRVSPNDFAIIRVNARIERMPPTGKKNGFNPKRVKIPSRVAKLLKNPAPDPPRHIPTQEELRAIAMNRQGKIGDIIAKRKADQGANVRDKVREMEEARRRREAAEKEVDRATGGAAQPPGQPGDPPR